MRSDRDKRTDTEREIDDFLSKFENPADELSADINSYLDEDEQERDDNDKNAVINDQDTVKKAPVQTFSWKIIDPPEIADQKDVLFNNVSANFFSSSNPPCGYLPMSSPDLLIRQFVSRNTFIPSFAATISSPVSLPTIRHSSALSPVHRSTSW